MIKVASGVSGAAPIWRRIILEALKIQGSEAFTMPGGIVTAEVDTVSGFGAHDGFPSRTEYFIRGTEPTGEDPTHVMLKVCKSSGQIATPVDVSRGDYDEKEFFIFKENDPTAGSTGENKWQLGIDEWLATQGDSRYHPPTAYCGTTSEIEVRIKDPQDRSQVGSTFKVKVEPISVEDINLVEIFVDDDKKAAFTSPPFEQELNLADGTYTIKAKARDIKGHSGEREIKIGVNIPWDWTPSPTPTPTLPATPTPIPPTPTP